MAKKDRRTYQEIAGELVRFLRESEGANGVTLVTNARGERAFCWSSPIRGRGPRVPCRMPVEIFEHFYGVYEWHIAEASG